MKASLLTTNASALDDLNQDAGGTNSGDSELQQQQKLLRQQLEFEQGMAVEREQRVRLIEADVLDVNEIMRDLGILISQQGENIGIFESICEIFLFYIIDLRLHLRYHRKSH